MHAGSVAERWGYKRDANRQSENPWDYERHVRERLAGLYGRWRGRHHGAITRHFHVHVNYANPGDVDLYIKMTKSEAPAQALLEEVLGDCVDLLRHDATYASISLYGPDASYVGACIVQPGYTDEGSVYWTTKPASSGSAPAQKSRAELPEIAKRVAETMRKKSSGCGNNVHAYPEDILRLGRAGLVLTAASILAGVVMLFVQASPNLFAALPAFGMAVGLFIMQAALSRATGSRRQSSDLC